MVERDAPPGPSPIAMLSPAQLRSRRLRNIALATAIVCLVVLFYLMTIAKMGAGFINRPI